MCCYIQQSEFYRFHPEVGRRQTRKERNHLPYPSWIMQCKAKQSPATNHLSAYSFTEIFLFLIVLLHFSKSQLYKVICHCKVWEQWENGEILLHKNQFCNAKNMFWIIQAFMFISVKPNPANYFQPGLVRTKRLDCFPSETERLSCRQRTRVFQSAIAFYWLSLPGVLNAEPY